MTNADDVTEGLARELDSHGWTIDGVTCECGEPIANGDLDTHKARAILAGPTVRELQAGVLEEAADELEARFRSRKTLEMPTDEWLRARAATIREAGE